MNTENKIVGWFLLAMGVGIILLALYLSYNIFSGQRPAPEIFKSQSEPTLSPKTTETDSTPSSEFDHLIQGLIGQQLGGFLPQANALPILMNFFTWSIFTGIMIFGGGQIARLGIQLLKPK